MKNALSVYPAGLNTADRITPSASWFPDTSLLLLLFCLVVANVSLAQPLDPVPPAEGSPIEKRIDQMRKRLQQPPPPPTGGFWVVEDRPGQKSPAYISYYTDQQQLILTDTLVNTRLDISRRAVVNRLNKRLSQLLDTYPAALVAAHQPIR